MPYIQIELEDDQLLDWCKKVIPTLEGEQVQVDGTMDMIKNIVDKRANAVPESVLNEAAQVGWYTFTRPNLMTMPTLKTRACMVLMR
jgi:hypothetical protein